MDKAIYWVLEISQWLVFIWACGMVWHTVKVLIGAKN